MEVETLRYRMQAATCVLSFVGFLVTALLIYGALAQARHWTFAGVPAWFSDLFHMTVTYGLVVLGTGALVMKEAKQLRKRRHEQIEDKHRSG
jgi:hypothetical protein